MLFDFKGKNTDLKKEILAGFTTFFAMCYILFVNGNIFANIPGVTFSAVYIGTGIATILGTLVLALLSDLPVVQSTSLGINTFFVFVCCLKYGFTYANSLLFVFVSGIVFLIFTLTGMRKILFEALPKCILNIIPAGIGLFVVFIGFVNSKITVADTDLCVTLNEFSIFNGKWANLMPCLVAVLTLFLMIILEKKKVFGGILISAVAGTILYYLLGLTLPDIFSNLHTDFNPVKAFPEFRDISFMQVFRNGMDFSAYLAAEGHNTFTLAVAVVTTVFSFCMLSMFDGFGTLLGCCRSTELMIKNEDGTETVRKMNEAMSSDAIATVLGAVCGTSSQTLYMESSAGINAGGRTGVTGLTVCVLFAVALFFAPFAVLVPSCVCGAVMIYIGLVIFSDIRNIQWDENILAGLMTLVSMTFTGNISYGIGFGLISYVFLKIFSGKIREVKPITWIVFVIFAFLIIIH